MEIIVKYDQGDSVSALATLYEASRVNIFGAVMLASDCGCSGEGAQPERWFYFVAERKIALSAAGSR